MYSSYNNSTAQHSTVQYKVTLRCGHVVDMPEAVQLSISAAQATEEQAAQLAVCGAGASWPHKPENVSIYCDTPKHSSQHTTHLKSSNPITQCGLHSAIRLTACHIQLYAGLS